MHTVSTGLACPREFNKRRHTYGALCAYFKLMLMVITLLMHSCLPFTTRLGLRTASKSMPGVPAVRGSCSIDVPGWASKGFVAKLQKGFSKHVCASA